MKPFALCALLIAVLGFATACSSDKAGSESGQELAVMKGCSACHAVDDTVKIGPTWVGLYGAQVELEDGSFVTADEAYLAEAIKDPNAKIVKGYARGSMPSIALADDEIDALVAYIKRVK